MEIQPASMAQVVEGRDGRRWGIDDDVGGIAKQLQEIDPKLRLQWNEKREFFMVVEVLEEGDGKSTERLVFSAKECDGRIVTRMRQIASPGYDFLAEIDQMDAQAEKDRDHGFSEKIGEAGEVAAHALRKDLEDQHRIVVPREVSDGA